MDTGEFKVQSTRRRDLPPIPQRGQRALPPMPSQDTGDDMPVPKSKKKKVKKEVEAVENVEDGGVQMGALNSRRASEVSKTSPETEEGPTQRRKRRKKPSSADPEGDQTDLVNGDGADQSADTEEAAKKPKKKKKPKVPEQPPYSDELDVEDDDIITDAQPPITQLALFSAPLGLSQPVGKVFVERNKRFQAADRSDRRKTSDQTDGYMDFHQPAWTTRDVAIRVHSGFRVIGLFCHGMLAGVAVWNIIVVYVLAGRHLTAFPNLLQQYHALAYPAQCLLYLLLAVSTVSAFDRVNLAKGSAVIREFVTLDPVALASFLYFCALVLSLSQQMVSDRINLYPSLNGTLWPSGSEHQTLHPWVIVNLVVALLVGLAWIFISSRPEMDYTEGFLLAMEIESQKPEEKLQTA